MNTVDGTVDAAAEITRASEALEAGHRVEVDNFNEGGAGATLAIARENSKRAAEANRQGYYCVAIYRDDSSESWTYKGTVDRATANELILRGAKYVGREDLLPTRP